MTTKAVSDRIEIHPDICFGKPHIKNTRIKVSFILELLASDWTMEEILVEYPHLEKDDIWACLDYASHEMD